MMECARGIQWGRQLVIYNKHIDWMCLCRGNQGTGLQMRGHQVPAVMKEARCLDVDQALCASLEIVFQLVLGSLMPLHPSGYW